MSYTIKIKLNKHTFVPSSAPSGYTLLSKNTELEIETNENGIPTSEFWRKRIRDSKKDKNVDILDPVKKPSEQKENKTKKETKENKASTETKSDESESTETSKK